MKIETTNRILLGIAQTELFLAWFDKTENLTKHNGKPLITHELKYHMKRTKEELEKFVAPFLNTDDETQLQVFTIVEALRQVQQNALDELNEIAKEGEENERNNKPTVHPL